MKYQLVIPNFCPVSDNQLVGRHWSDVHRLKKADKEVIGYYFRESGILPAKGRRRLSATFYTPRGCGDPWNKTKSLLDAAVTAKAIVDDSEKWLELGRLTMAKGPRQTVITLEDL